MTYETIGDAVTMQGSAEATLLAGRYRVVRQLGQGGMGSVWLAEDTQLDNKQFAIKMLPSVLVSNKRAYRQLKDEALVAMRLTHSNIVTLRAFEENNGNPFLVMDYIDGETLDDYLAEKGKLTEDDVLGVLRPIAAALDCAHSKGVVHRDVKPGNVMIAKDGTPYILDFGIAREIQETMTRVTGKLSSGTLLYMSPEQLHGAAPKKEQDIYSFAAMAYECLKGEPPFSRGQIEFQIDNDTPEPLGLTGGAAILAARIMAGLAKKPEDRPPTCAAILEGKISRVEHVERVEKSEGGARSDGSLGKVFAVLALLTVLVAGGYYAWTKSRGVPENEESIASRQNVPAKQSGKPSSPEPTPPAEPKTPTVDEADIIEIRVRAAKCENAMGRISDEDGFDMKKASLSDVLAAARAYDNYRSWGQAAAAYTNYVNSFKVLAQMNKDRIDARSKRDAASEARQAASDASASQYAPPRWSEADRLFNAAKDAWLGMNFPDSAKNYDLAAKQYGLAKDEADKERNRQVEEQREKERKAAVERERRKNWPTEGREFTIDRYSLGMTMKWCPAGSFMMGSPPTEEGRYNNETQHRVTLTRGFWLGETEVTQRQWKQLMGGETIIDLARKGLHDDNLYESLPEGKKLLRDYYGLRKDSELGFLSSFVVDDSYPIAYISWREAVEFCRMITAKERLAGCIPNGYEYRLPTEAEWEYACRADSKQNAQQEGLEDIAWHRDNSDRRMHFVKSKLPNAWGLYDMLGNVWEWCQDSWYGYKNDQQTDPCCDISSNWRVNRGGSYFAPIHSCRPACRGRFEEGVRVLYLGFRVALAPILSKDDGDVGASAEALASDKIQTNLVRVSANGGESAADTSSDALLYNESPQFVVHETQPATLTDTTELQRKYNAKHGLSGTHRPSDDSDIIEGKEDAESAKLRREMVEQQRRRLYPEYYENHPQKNSGNMQSHHVIENTLTEFEKSEGWNLLWDGRTFNGWLAVKSGCKTPPEKGWFIKDGTLTMRPTSGITNGKWFPLPAEAQRLGGGGDIVTVRKYRDFAFKFDFRLTECANSGVKYFYDETLNKGTCEEYQILENGHPDATKGKDGNRKVAALYDIYPANGAERLLKGPGEWNTGMVVSKSSHVEHWLNGVKVLEYDRGTDAFKTAVKKSKYAKWGRAADGKPQDWGEIPEGRLLLQDHGDSTVSFRNLKIKEL